LGRLVPQRAELRRNIPVAVAEHRALFQGLQMQNACAAWMREPAERRAFVALAARDAVRPRVMSRCPLGRVRGAPGVLRGCSGAWVGQRPMQALGPWGSVVRAHQLPRGSGQNLGVSRRWGSSGRDQGPAGRRTRPIALRQARHDRSAIARPCDPAGHARRVASGRRLPRQQPPGHPPDKSDGSAFDMPRGLLLDRQLPSGQPGVADSLMEPPRREPRQGRHHGYAASIG
jgi:hypothetical protein